MFNRDALLNIVKDSISNSAAHEQRHATWMHRIERRDFKNHTNIVLRHMGFKDALNEDIIASLNAAGYKAEAYKGSYYVGSGWSEVFTRIKCYI